MTGTGKCKKCGETVFLQTSQSGSIFYTNTDDKTDWHSKTCTKQSVPPQPTLDTPLNRKPVYKRVEDAVALYKEYHLVAKQLSDLLYPNTSNKDASIQGIINFIQRETNAAV